MEWPPHQFSRGQRSDLWGEQTLLEWDPWLKRLTLNCWSQESVRHKVNQTRHFSPSQEIRTYSHFTKYPSFVKREGKQNHRIDADHPRNLIRRLFDVVVDSKQLVSSKNTLTTLTYTGQSAPNKTPHYYSWRGTLKEKVQVFIQP